MNAYRNISRREMLKLLGVGAGAAVLAACTPAAVPTAAPSGQTTTGPLVNSVGVELPEDAAPLDQQVVTHNGLEGKHFDATRNIYETNGMTGYALEPLVWLDNDFNAYPGAADSWSTSDDGLTWTFNLRQNAKWSDGTPVTADTWVYSLRRMFSPEIANPYAWFYASIKNVTEVQQGNVPLEELGVAKVDDYTLTITTSQPIPYLLLLMGFIATIVPQHIIESVGDGWDADPATFLSNGPYMVGEWKRGEEVVFVLNPQYDGPRKGKVEKIVYRIVEQGLPSESTLAMYEANETDYEGISGAALQQAIANPAFEGQLDTYAQPTTFYMHFKTDAAPFDNLKVRQAISHAIDREAISQQVMQELEIPGYTMLPPGFPCSQADNPEIRAIQAYDPELAKQLLAEAGYPDGAGFPEFELWTRQGQIVRESEAIQSMLKENLGITVTPKDVERSLYMDTLRAHNLSIGLIQWAQDYSDPTNFMDWWATQSRHPWINEEYNALVNEARSELDTTRRCELYQQAERILIEDVAAVFIGHPIQGFLVKPNLGGIRVSSGGARTNYQAMWSDWYKTK